MKIYAIIPARSGSIGLKDKNIKPLSGKPLLSYSIEFAKKLNLNRVFCSTDSSIYAEIAKQYGAEVPFLRSATASSSVAMEQHILADLYSQFKQNNIPQPDLIVWLRPTFVFRDIDSVNKCIEILKANKNITSARTVCESECRLYDIDQNNMLIPTFDDEGKSMIRRQDIGTRYKVFSTDVFRADEFNTTEDFLGRHVAAVPINKICGLDIDDEFDFRLVESLITNCYGLVKEYL
jgi:CMP-N,N'-diacetyllegionaminic acid synthase